MGQFNVHKVPLVFKKEEPIIPYVEEIIEDENDDDIDIAKTFAEAESRIAEKDSVKQFLNRQFAFVTGPAGSGKTYAINEQNLRDSSYIELGATTGIAAINLDTKTINSILKYFDTDSLQESYIDQRLHWRLREIREEKRNIGIEEISMMDARALDILFDAIYEINQDKNPKKLGLHLIGDLLQLPVVSTKTKSAEMVIKAKCWPYFEQNTLRLTKIWRQDNPKFVEAINLVRSGNGERAVSLLKECGVNLIPKLIDKFDGTTLITKNDQVDDYNAQRLAEINIPIINLIPLRRGEQLSEWKNQVPNVMRFKIGAYVMILSNDTPNFTYVNGDTGIILDYNQKEDYFLIKLKRNDKEVKISRIMRKNLTRKQPEQKHFNNYFTPYVDSLTKKWVIGDIAYHPLRLAWATTVHKCLDPETLVFTDLGTKKLKDIKIGDSLFNGQNFQKVLVIETTKQKQFEIITKHGYEVVCSPEHKFPVKYFIREAKRLQHGDKLYISRNDQSLFTDLIDKDFAWLLGALVGDGSYRDRKDGTIELSSEDIDIQKEAYKIITSFGINYCLRKDKIAGYFTSKRFRQMLLDEFGMDYALAPNKTIPIRIFSAQKSAKAAFIAGLFDTDGCIKNNSIVLTTASEILGKQLQILLLDFGIMSHRSSIKTTYKEEEKFYYQVMIPQIFHKKFVSEIELRLTRKKNLLKKLKKANRIIDRNYLEWQDEIISLGSSDIEIDMIDLELEGDHLFIANGIVTHNSQGLSLDRVQIDATNNFFGFPGMSYVAISRCRTPENLFIVGNEINLIRKIKTNPEVKNYV